MRFLLSPALILKNTTNGPKARATGTALSRFSSVGASCLTKPFQLTAENLERLRQVNNHLSDLTKRAYNRFGEIEADEYYMTDCEDDGYDVESHIRFIYQGDESVLKLDDDDYYGSNFTLIIKALSEVYIAKGQENIIYARVGKKNQDDGESWLDEPFFKWRNRLHDIIICYAVHDLTSIKLIPFPTTSASTAFCVSPPSHSSA